MSEQKKDIESREEKQALRLYLEWDKLTERNRTRRLNRLSSFWQREVLRQILRDKAPRENARIVECH